LVYSFMPNFTPIGASMGVRDQKTKKITLKCYKISKYKRPAGAYPLHDFHDICSTFQVVSAVKTWMESLKGLRSYGGFNLRWSGFSLSPGSAETLGEVGQQITIRYHTLLATSLPKLPKSVVVSVQHQCRFF